MRKRRTVAKLVVVATITALATSSCATIISGSTQKIAVTSMPDGATVTSTPGNFQVTTPAQLALRRKDGPYTLKFEKAGYQPYEVRLSTDTNGWLFGNLLIGGLIGIVIDMNTGAAEKLTPERVHANLTQVKLGLRGSTDDTVIVFAADGSLLAAITLVE